MNVLQAVLLGVLQGFFEWLPISSEGNLIIIMNTLLGIGTQQAFHTSILLHLGTALSAVVYYRKDVKNAIMLKDKGLLKFLIITTTISVAIGGALYFVVKDLSASIGALFLGIIGISLIITGIVQLQAGKRTGLRSKCTRKDTIVAGVAQGISIIPGLSRSGITTSALLLMNVKAKDALRYSFLMSIPAIIIGETGLAVLNGFAIAFEDLLGLASAFVAGILMIKILTKIAQKVNFGKFTIFLGALSLLPLAFL